MVFRFSTARLIPDGLLDALIVNGMDCHEDIHNNKVPNSIDPTIGPIAYIEQRYHIKTRKWLVVKRKDGKIGQK